MADLFIFAPAGEAQQQKIVVSCKAIAAMFVKVNLAH
jgi:hypothetical protein